MKTILLLSMLSSLASLNAFAADDQIRKREVELPLEVSVAILDGSFAKVVETARKEVPQGYSLKMGDVIMTEHSAKPISTINFELLAIKPLSWMDSDIKVLGSIEAKFIWPPDAYPILKSIEFEVPKK